MSEAEVQRWFLTATYNLISAVQRSTCSKAVIIARHHS